MNDTERDFPDDYDMEAKLKVEQSQESKIDASLWESALCYDSPYISEQLCTPSLYHAVIEQPLIDALIGIGFTFEVCNGQILANGTAHPAREVRRDYYTDTDTIIDSTQVIVEPKSEETAVAIREYIAARRMDQGRDTASAGASTGAENGTRRSG